MKGGVAASNVLIRWIFIRSWIRFQNLTSRTTSSIWNPHSSCTALVVITAKYSSKHVTSTSVCARAIGNKTLCVCVQRQGVWPMEGQQPGTGEGGQLRWQRRSGSTPRPWLCSHHPPAGEASSSPGHYGESHQEIRHTPPPICHSGRYSKYFVNLKYGFDLQRISCRCILICIYFATQSS